MGKTPNGGGGGQTKFKTFPSLVGKVLIGVEKSGNFTLNWHFGVKYGPIGAQKNPKFSKNSQGGGQKILNIPKFQNIPKLGGGGGAPERLGVFPKFYRFFNWTASLSITEGFWFPCRVSAEGTPFLVASFFLKTILLC